MSWKESVRLFLDNNLDRRRYVTGVLTGVTISLVLATASAVYLLVIRFIQWVASITSLLVDTPIVNQESLGIIALFVAMVIMSLSLLRLVHIVNRIGDRAEASSNSRETALAAEVLNELLRSATMLREEWDQNLLERQGSPSFSGVTGEEVPETGIYQSLDSPIFIISRVKGDTFPPVWMESVTGKGDMRSTIWRFRGRTYDEAMSTIRGGE